METGDGVRSLAQSLRLAVFESYDKYVKPGMSVEEALVELLSREGERRREALVKRRIREAGLPNGKTIDTFRLVPSIPHLKEEQVRELSSCQFIRDGMNVCALGGSGTGKSHLMAAVGRRAVQMGYTVRFLRVSDMVTMLSEANAERKLGAMMKSLMKADLLELDELCEASHNSSHVKRF